MKPKATQLRRLPRGRRRHSGRHGSVEAGHWASRSILPGLTSGFFCACPSKRLITPGTLAEAREKAKRGERMGRREPQQPLLASTFPGRDPDHNGFSSHLHTSAHEAPCFLETRSLHRCHGRGPTCHTGPQMARAEVPPLKSVPPPSRKPPYRSQRGMSVCLTRCCPARGWWMQIDST